MEEYTQITIDQWISWKEDIRQKLQETAQNFVYIGYRLKQIRDSEMLDGCQDIFEFAQKEYGISKSATSRFIAINEKYSEGGNSLELRKEYSAYSSSKLSEMLTLPDNECQLITERTTVKQIRELKEFNRSEPKDEGGTVYTPLQKCIIDYFKDKREVLNKVMWHINIPFPPAQDIKAAAELINPSGNGTHKKGIVFLFMYDYAAGVKYKNMMEPQPISMSWEEFLREVADIYGSYTDGELDVYQEYYGVIVETEPKIEEQNTAQAKSNQGFEAVATSQQNDEEEENNGEDTEQSSGEADSELSEEYSESDSETIEEQEEQIEMLEAASEREAENDNEPDQDMDQGYSDEEGTEEAVCGGLESIVRDEVEREQGDSQNGEAVKNEELEEDEEFLRQQERLKEENAVQEECKAIIRTLVNIIDLPFPDPKKLRQGAKKECNSLSALMEKLAELLEEE